VIRGGLTASADLDQLVLHAPRGSVELLARALRHLVLLTCVVEMGSGGCPVRPAIPW
jgi:hypothetical protein